MGTGCLDHLGTSLSRAHHYSRDVRAVSTPPLEPSAATTDIGHPASGRMRQVVVGKAGSIVVTEVPIPTPCPGEVLVRTEYSLISSGTESAVRSQSGSLSALGRKALSDPRFRSKALDRLRTHGIRATLQEARRRASSDQALGYSAAGTVAAVGSSVSDLAIGQRVAAAGAGYANHAEWIAVPRTLVSRVPDDVPSDHAAFATVGAVALHAFRLGRCELGGTVAVVGLGLVGQLAAQIADAAGCRVVGVDPLSARCERARLAVPAGIFLTQSDLLLVALGDLTNGVGADAVLITASTADPTLANSSLRLARDRGRVVAVGDVRLTLDRDVMYRKELELVVSRSYGPGRYDPDYEERGIDYPVGYVRWTVGRNLDTVLGLIERGRLRLDPLITASIPVAEAARAYQLLNQPDEHLAVLLRFAGSLHSPQLKSDADIPTSIAQVRPVQPPIRLALIGPGQFATGTLIPALTQLRDRLLVTTVVASTGSNAASVARRLSAAHASTSLDDALAGADFDAVLIATRHDTHAGLARRCLAAGRHVFVEKPLGLTVEDCQSATAEAEAQHLGLMVDFNRRFSTYSTRLKSDISTLPGGVAVTYSVNAGRLPMDHWLLDRKIGGGRILGEAVHFLDFLCWLFDSDPIAIMADPRAVLDAGNEVLCTLTFPRGCSAVLLYSARGSPRMPKERIDVIAGGHSWTIDDFRRLERDSQLVHRGQQDKGHTQALASFAAYISGSGHNPSLPTGKDGLRATRLALEVQGLRSPRYPGSTSHEP